MSSQAPPPPEKPKVIPPASPSSIPCPSCGWPNPPGSVRCEFCRTPFERPAPPPPPPDIVCPHCGGVRPMVKGQRRCPDCGRGYAEPPSPVRKAMAMAIRGIRSIRLSGPTIVVLILITTPLTFFTIQFRAHRKAQTADHIRNIKKSLEIWNGQNGGFPETLEEMARFGGGPTPMPHELIDGWGKPLRYTARRPFGRGDFGRQMFAEYDLRSAGPNGDFDDEDDMFWVGKADDAPPGMPPMPMGPGGEAPMMPMR